DAVTSVDEAPETQAAPAIQEAPGQGEKKLIARDPKNVPLLSAWHWHGEAVERILRVPAGFLRHRAPDRLEALAAGRGVEAITLALAEDGTAIGRQLMEEMLKNQEAAKAGAEAGAGASLPADASHEVAMEERKPPINEVGSPSALQARRAGPHPQ